MPRLLACLLLAAVLFGSAPGAHAQTEAGRCKDVAQVAATVPGAALAVPREGAQLFATGPLLYADEDLRPGPGLPKARFIVDLLPDCDVLLVIHPDDYYFDSGSTAFRYVMTGWGHGYVAAASLQPYPPEADETDSP